MFQSYLLVNKETNVVENCVEWDGSDIWSVPDGYIAIPRDSTEGTVWQPNVQDQRWDLNSIVGVGAIGYTWDGSKFNTPDAKPEVPVSCFEAPNKTGTGTPSEPATVIG